MKIKMPDKNTMLTICSAVTLLGIATVFGFMSMPTEMGLAVLAGALGMAFSNIDKISEFSGAGFSAKMRDQMQKVIDKETEPEVEAESDALPNDIITLREQDSNAEKALLALSDSKWTWRSLGGIAKAISQKPGDALNTLELLIIAGLAEKGHSKTGAKLWSPTARGSSIAAIIERTSKNISA